MESGETENKNKIKRQQADSCCNLEQYDSPN